MHTWYMYTGLNQNYHCFIVHEEEKECVLLQQCKFISFFFLKSDTFAELKQALKKIPRVQDSRNTILSHIHCSDISKNTIFSHIHYSDNTVIVSYLWSARQRRVWVSSATLKLGILDHRTIKTVHIWPFGCFERWFRWRGSHMALEAHMSALLSPLTLRRSPPSLRTSPARPATTPTADLLPLGHGFSSLLPGSLSHAA